MGINNCKWRHQILQRMNAPMTNFPLQYWEFSKVKSHWSAVPCESSLFIQHGRKVDLLEK